MKLLKHHYPDIWIIIFLVIISIPLIMPYFHHGYFPTHDGEWAVVRLSDMYRSIKDGQLPVRFSGNLNFGYGYPLFNFAYPFPYYMGMPFVFLKLGFVNTIKLLFALSVMLSACTMYLFSKTLWNNKLAGFVGAILYIYLPYRLVDMYVRGSLGESLSFVLFPLILLAVYHFSQKKSSFVSVISGACCYAALIMTHNIMAVLFTPILLLFLILQFMQDRRVLRPALFFLLLSFGLGAFFFIPALLEKNLILLSKIPIADRNLYFVSLRQLFLPSWGYGTPTDKDAFTYQMGLPQLIALLAALTLSAFSIFWSNKKTNEDMYAFVFSIAVCIMVVLLFSQTSFIWQSLPLLKEINYPWTLLSQIGFIASLLCGYLVVRLQKYRYGVFVLALLAVIFFLPYAHPKAFVDHGDSFYLTNDATTTSSDELMPLWVKKHPSQRVFDKVALVQGGGRLQDIVSRSTRLRFTADLNQTSTVQINTIYYPGWQVTIDGKPEIIDYNNPNGVMQVTVPKGLHFVRANFFETPMRFVSDSISVLTLFFIVGFFVVKKINMRKI